ncbi:unnamed protein product [Urochloa decumbens]|uniref:Uncharacterized protein n=1 Tax=Urochloa decumbens TaxID=240449 RepID=A0ABC9G4Y7_9POAL
MRKYRASLVALANFEKEQCASEEKRFGERFPDGGHFAFQERLFGHIAQPGEKVYRASAEVETDLSSIVVSLALFDGDKMLFACSGIPIPHGKTRLQLTRFVTSAHLVRAFKDCRNKDDKLRVSVCLPGNKTTDGFLGLYDDDIAIVTCLGVLDICPIDLNVKETPATHVSPDDTLLAAGRAYMSGHLMTMHGPPCGICDNTWVPDDQSMNKAALGGPLLQKDARFLGMIYDFFDNGDQIVIYSFLPLELLYKRLEHFEILNPKQLHFFEYKLPTGVSSIVPSGFMKTIYRLKSYGYPMPPPLVLEFNGQLLNQFEERFGDLLAWKGYPYGHPTSFSRERVWERLPKRVVTDISRRVVSLASFNGLLIKWHGSKAMRTVILTSASLIRNRCNEDEIDKTLRIEVFLPPNQRGSGTLEFYNLNYNIAIISVKKNFNAVRAEDMFSEIVPKPSEKVVAIGRDTIHGPLMASIGKVNRSNKGNKLSCKDLWVSTCKIKKAGIGGPLVTFDGSFVGMNFYDESGVTPCLPKRKIAQVLRGVINFPLLSESDYDHPMPIDVGDEGTKKNRWPVPEPYWYHGALDMDRYHVPKLIGRHLD